MTITPPPPALAAVDAAIQRLHDAVRTAARRGVDSLALAVHTGVRSKDREVVLTAHFELTRYQGELGAAYAERHRELVRRELEGTSAGWQGDSLLQWDTLSLVDDDEVEAKVVADRLGQSIHGACEWELRELDAYVGALLEWEAPRPARNPLRPELVGRAVVDALKGISSRADVRQVVATEIGRGLVAILPKVYAEIAGHLRDVGVQPLRMALRAAADRQGGAESGTRSPATAATAGGTTRPGGFPSTGGSGPGALRGRDGAVARDAAAPGPHGPAAAGGSSAIAPVTAELTSLIRRLAQFEVYADSGAGLGHDALGVPTSNWVRGADGAPVAPNLIHAHRDELRRASTGTLDHMVIDVVAGLFDQILSDPKVPPQLARQIARLQLPVLRVALGDATFFSSRRHPVRRFVNRLASLAVAFDDLDDGAGREFLGHVRSLVQQIVDGDFDQIQVYERRLAELEAFNAAQVKREVQERAPEAVQLLERKEGDLVVQQRYTQRLKAELAAVQMPDFLRTFLAEVWSQAIVAAVRREGEAGMLPLRLRRAGRDLVMSVQPKGTPAERKAFLMALPPLMKDLHEALASIGWPEEAKKAFFGQLLPLHAESLKHGSISQLDYNLLAKRLDAVLGAPLPPADHHGGALQGIGDGAAENRFSAEEAQRIGLVRESAVDWTAKVDIDLSEEPEVTAEDVRLDGLPAPDAVEPASGAALAALLQLGFAYRMHLEGGWHKVRLTYVSPGRAFFVFTHGRKHQRTISMTARMVTRMCEAGRLRRFENAYLLERATARARKQLAALRTGAAARTAAAR